MSHQKPQDPSDSERIYAFADAVEAENQAAASAAPAAPPPRPETWITFELSNEVFALPIEPVREVLRVTDITRVPHAPNPVRGVTQLRGRVIPVVDLGLRLGLPARSAGRSSRILVAESRGRLLGLLVDSVHQVIKLDRNRAQTPPEDVVTPSSDFVTAVYHLGARLVLMLDVDRTLILREPLDAA